VTGARTIGALALSSALAAWCAPAAAADPAAGERVFQYFCVRCHGSNADGQSELAKLLNPRPANLRVSKLDPAQQAQIILFGGAARGRSASMPAWGDQIDSEQLTALVHYLQGLRQPDSQVSLK
jgi:mono/diheme cytochrome c family protein